MLPFLRLSSALASSFCLMKPNLGISFSLLNMVTGASVGPKTKINPFLQVVCHSCVNLALLINTFDSVCVCGCSRVSGHICMNACLTAIKRVEACELMLHLHSCFQIKAKNYDKVEKVSVCQNTHLLLALVSFRLFVVL